MPAPNPLGTDDFTALDVQRLKFLSDAPLDGNTYGRKNGAWSVVGGGIGDVVGPAGAVSGNFASFDGVTGKLIKDSGYNSSSFQAANVTLASIAALADAAGWLHNSGAGALGWSTPPGTPPGGSDTYVQYNDGGAFGGDSSLTWDYTHQVLTLTGNPLPIIQGVANGTSIGLRFAGGDQSIANGSGGKLQFYGGGGHGNGSGGALDFTAGNAGSIGDGGDITFTGGVGGTAGGGGGSVIFIPGQAHLGMGSVGQLIFTFPGLGRAIFASVMSTDRLFTFPNVAGTFALVGQSPLVVNPSVVGNFVSFSSITGAQADSGYNSSSFAPAAHNILSTTHGDTLAGAVADGSIIIGNVTPKWSALAVSIPAANVRNVLGVDNGETRPSWKTALDGTAPTTIAPSAAAAAGTSLVFSHRDHTHGAPATYPATAHNLLSTTHGDTTAASVVRGDIVTGQGASPTWARLAISAPAATFMNYLGAANGDTEPGYKALFDATVPTTIAENATAAAGTAVVAARRDHTHGAPVTWAPTAHNVLSASHGDTLAGAVADGSIIIGNVTPKWSALAVSIPAANVRNVLGVDNGETRPSWKTALDSTAPTSVTVGGSASAGTSLVFSHRDHTHGAPATWAPTAHNILSTSHGDTTAASVVRGDIITGQGASPTWTRLAKGTAGAVLTGDGTDVAWSGYYFSGTAGGTTNFAVTNAKTLTLTATNTYNLTIPGTGTAVLAVNPSVVGNFVSFSNVTGGQADSGYNSSSFQAANVTLASIAALANSAGSLQNDGFGNLQWDEPQGYPSGNEKDIQYNHLGSFAASDNFTFDDGSIILTLAGLGGLAATIQGKANAAAAGLTINGGNNTALASPGGPVTIQAGNGNTSGVGGIAKLAGGAGGATNANGGAVILAPGVKGGAGNNGQIKMLDPTSAINAIFDTSVLATSDKTFTFPNISGTFALLPAINAFTAAQSITGTVDTTQLTVTGFTTQAIATPLIKFVRNDTTAGMAEMLRLTGKGSGSNNDGIQMRYNSSTSTTADTSMAADNVLWINATHASRTAARVFYIYDTSVRMALIMQASGSASMLGFFGANAVVQPLATDDLGTALSNMGLRAAGTAYPITTSGTINLSGTVGLGSSVSAFSMTDALTINGSKDVQQLTVNGYASQALVTRLVRFVRKDTNAGLGCVLGLYFTGSGAIGDGGYVSYEGKDSTTAGVGLGSDFFYWVTPTHGSQKARRVFNVYDTAIREALRMEASGTAPMLGFYGASAVIRAVTGGASAAFVANSGTAINTASTFGGYTIAQVVQALQNVGLLT